MVRGDLNQAARSSSGAGVAPQLDAKEEESFRSKPGKVSLERGHHSQALTGAGRRLCAPQCYLVTGERHLTSNVKGPEGCLACY